jgi:hypothetical protein
MPLSRTVYSRTVVPPEICRSHGARRGETESLPFYMSYFLNGQTPFTVTYPLCHGKRWYIAANYQYAHADDGIRYESLET